MKKKSTDSPVKKWHYIFLFVFAFILYANTLRHDYAFDDAVAITGNSFTQQGIHGIPDLLKKDFFEGIYGQAMELGGGRWRPLSLVTFAIEKEIAGDNPHLSHWLNVILYGITAIFLFITLQKILPNKSLLNFLITLLFIAHPVHTEVVANIKSRDEIFSFLGLCLTIFWLFKSLETKKKKYIIYSCIAYFLALTSKENGITFAAIIPLTLFCFANKTWKESFRKSIPFFITAFVYVVIRWKLVGMIGDRENPDIMENPFVGATLGEKYATVAKILGIYIWKLVAPVTLSSDYSFNEIPRVGWSDIGAITSLLIYVSLATYSIIRIKKKTSDVRHMSTVVLIAYGILFYLITMSIVSNIVFNIGAPMGERFLYLPSLGFCIVISVLLLNILKIANWDNLKFNAKIFIPAGIILVFFSYKTIARNPDWYDNKTLFTADAKNAPNSAKVHHYYGNSFLTPQIGKPDSPQKTEDLKTALREEKIAVKINPIFHHAYYNIGLIYQEFQNTDSALWNLNKVLELQPKHILAQSAIGAVYGKLKGDYEKAIYHLNIAVKYNPKDVGSWENLGIANAMKGNFPESLKAFREALRYKQNDARLYLNTAITYQNMKDSVNAKIYFEKAFTIDPSLRQPNKK